MNAKCCPAAKNRNLILLILCLSPLLVAACAMRERGSHAAALPPTPSPTPTPAPVISYLHDGELWRAAIDDPATAQILAAPPSGEVISDFAWSADGSSIYFLAGTQVSRVAVADKSIETIGVPQLPPDLLVDRLEITVNPRLLIVWTMDAEGAQHAYSFNLDDKKTSELSIDGYNSLARPAPRLVRQFADLSVGPDQKRLLFKEVIGTNEELFVADIDTGARRKLTDLGTIEGFEESAQADGTRRVIESAWSPDGRFALFNPAQSCSETGLCYGYLYLVDTWGGETRRISQEMVVGITVDWSPDGNLIVHEDGGQIVVIDRGGVHRRLTEGSRPKWQPGSDHGPTGNKE